MNPEAEARQQLIANLRQIGDSLAANSGHLSGDDKVRIAIFCKQAANEIEETVKFPATVLDYTAGEFDLAEFVEQAILGTERRYGIWTMRDYLVHVLAYLKGSDKARSASIAAPPQVKVPRLDRKDAKAGQAGYFGHGWEITMPFDDWRYLDAPAMLQLTVEADA